MVTPNCTATINLNVSDVVKTTALIYALNPKTYPQNVHFAVITTRQTTGDVLSTRIYNVYEKKHQSNTNSRVIIEESTSPQTQSSSQTTQGEIQHHENGPLVPQTELNDTQHTYSQVTKGSKPNKLSLDNSNGHLPDQSLTSQLTTFIFEF